MTRDTTRKAGNVLLVLLGVAALVLKSRYAGPFPEMVHSYGGNASVSFAVYFLIRIATSGGRHGKLLSATVALLVVSLFEATDGFGVMTNVYDPADFAANALGAGLALVVDILASPSGYGRHAGAT